MKIAIALLLVAGAVLLSGVSDAFPGDPCRHSHECGPRELCVADAWTSEFGHCQAIRVLQ